MDLDDWITNSNECFFINFTRPSADAPRILEEPFNPRFTYPIFGNEENIIGYKEPEIWLDFRANDGKPSLDVKFTHKFPLQNLLPDAEQIDLDNILREHLPASAFEDGDAPESDGPDATSADWKPPGEQMHSFELHGKKFEIWRTRLDHVRGKEIFENLRILVELFIEAGQPPKDDDDEERWTLFLLYEVTPLEDSSISPYTIAGFCTCYRYWIFPTKDVLRFTKSLPSPPASSNGDATTQDPDEPFNNTVNLLDTPSRERISQFVILPPYQGQSLGAKLYESIFGYLTKLPNIFQVAVEEPSEEFDKMRDYSDIVYLRKNPVFQSLTIPTELPPETMRKDAPIPRDLILGNGVNLEDLRKEVKIVPRQFNRVLEIHLYSTIPISNRNTARITRKEKSSNENDRRYYFWRLALKDRIYRQSADILEQIEAGERVEAIENAVVKVEEEYTERLEGLRVREKWNIGEVPVENGSSSRSKRKRAVVESDEDDWEDVEEEVAASSKKRRA
ncbi:acyl-CoA N-acyltransferase [Amniculicola lignicola CBS 123094]|uniref:Histone acetyltransferase type B catalytic subunit n=1 Tax=Amniculicola lignicola CBS 123094 TaxID=1392246 RepID=A0A6A5W5H7_9PLEO|nr:acyl-CoA N-acyltransferase [Amniculicola lignicola CBS 123094]